MTRCFNYAIYSKYSRLFGADIKLVYVICEWIGFMELRLFNWLNVVNLSFCYS
jgi:hypothetical protein